MEFEQLKLFGKSKKNCSKKRTKTRKNDKNLKVKLKELYLLHGKLYDKLNISLFEQREIIKIGNIIAFPEYREAEINGTQFLSIDERIKVHKEYLDE